MGKTAVAPRVVRTFEEARDAFSGEDELALDLETGGFSPWRDPLHVITLYGPKSDTVAVLHYPKGRSVPTEVMLWLASFPELVMHNGTMFDVPFLLQNGMPLAEWRLYDTLVGELAVLATGRRDVRVNLADTANRRLGKTIDKSIDHAGWGALDLSENHLAYVLGDIRYLVELKHAQLKRAKETGPGVESCVAFEMGLTKPIIKMEMNGLPVDLKAIDAYFESQQGKMVAAQQYLAEKLGPILLSSSKQLKAALGEKFGEKQFPDTKAERLMGYVMFGGELGAVCEALLTWRLVTQRRNMFGSDWRDAHAVWHDGHYRVHGKFWQIGTTTGRMSSSQPNLQQVPRDMRMCFGNRPGWAVGKTDYAAIEVRVAAALAPDEVMIAAFNEGKDIHRVVASAGFGKPYDEITKEERSIAKAMSFTLLFGGSVQTFRAYASSHGSQISVEDAERAIASFFEEFKGIRRMRDIAMAQAASRRVRVLEYPTGLRRVLQGHELRGTTILNNIVQGTAAAGLKYALMEIDAAGLGHRLCAVVHDEIVYDAPVNEIEEVRATIDACMLVGMRRALEGCPPIALGVESTWGPTWAGLPENVKETAG